MSLAQAVLFDNGVAKGSEARLESIMRDLEGGRPGKCQVRRKIALSSNHDGLSRTCDA